MPGIVARKVIILLMFWEAAIKALADVIVVTMLMAMALETIYDTPARTALLAWIGEDPKTRTKPEIGRLLGVSYQAVGYWLAGHTRPEDGRTRQLISVLTGIPVSDWETRKERDAFAEALGLIRSAEAMRAADSDAA